MVLSKSERESLANQLFEVIATVGFLTWKEQYREDFVAQLASDTPAQIRQEYFQMFEQVQGGEIQEMARNASDERLKDTLRSWMERAEAMALVDRNKDADWEIKQPSKGHQREIER